MQALHQSYEKLFKSTAIFRCLHQPECCTLNSRLDFFYFSLERLRRSNSKDTVSLCRLPAQTWLKWLGWQKTMQWENCCLMNQISLAKRVDSRVSAMWLGRRKRRPFQCQWTIRWPQLSCTTCPPPPREQLQLSFKKSAWSLTAQVENTRSHTAVYLFSSGLSLSLL